ncbi:ATP synthase F1, epsilon subunit [Solidesulfovibrio carbinoliphilus subsp. oakridgensis]|uniref:ATP synthase epsilon chain n=1 Tax=Solidesulfovibrio carbinoliphilus subsp. oakridgensis TaxID=694327 RepID=G7QAH0_9BACT|nr:F0F1 ATP synthase subunit epsilon [Solidesulfovibrio carbinoliphilus]EHJ48723.1 ATP synthase F1, epsilon subunit [Solidesulfovibrio carbinoliphilus subsp. oakridgensis]
MAQLLLEIVTPDKLVLSQDVDYVGAPGLLGEFGVMANHIPFLSALGIGSLMYKVGGKANYVFVSGGFAEVSGNKVTILAEVAERPEDIDVERARKAQDRAKQRLDREREKVDFARAQAAMQRAFYRMKVRDTATSTASH